MLVLPELRARYNYAPCIFDLFFLIVCFSSFSVYARLAHLICSLPFVLFDLRKAFLSASAMCYADFELFCNFLVDLSASKWFPLERFYSIVERFEKKTKLQNNKRAHLMHVQIQYTQQWPIATHRTSIDVSAVRYFIERTASLYLCIALPQMCILHLKWIVSNLFVLQLVRFDFAMLSGDVRAQKSGV